MVKEILLSEAVLGFVVGLAATIIYRYVILKLPAKAKKIVLDTFEFIEANYKEWGIFGSEKMAKLVQVFIDKFKAEFGAPPTPNQIGQAVKIAEGLVSAQKNSATG
mgnify:CR=1 FL=1